MRVVLKESSNFRRNTKKNRFCRLWTLRTSTYLLSSCSASKSHAVRRLDVIPKLIQTREYQFVASGMPADETPYAHLTAHVNLLYMIHHMRNAFKGT